MHNILQFIKGLAADGPGQHRLRDKIRSEIIPAESAQGCGKLAAQQTVILAGGAGDTGRRGLIPEDDFVALFSESASRAVVATTADRVDALLIRADELGVPAATIGATDDSSELKVGGVSIAVSELYQAWSATLPELFGHAVGANSVVE